MIIDFWAALFLRGKSSVNKMEPVFYLLHMLGYGNFFRCMEAEGCLKIYA